MPLESLLTLVEKLASGLTIMVPHFARTRR